MWGRQERVCVCFCLVYVCVCAVCVFVHLRVFFVCQRAEREREIIVCHMIHMNSTILVTHNSLWWWSLYRPILRSWWSSWPVGRPTCWSSLTQMPLQMSSLPGGSSLALWMYRKPGGTNLTGSLPAAELILAFPSD